MNNKYTMLHLKDMRYQTSSAQFIIYLFLGNDSGTSITLEDM